MHSKKICKILPTLIDEFTELNIAEETQFILESLQPAATSAIADGINPMKDYYFQEHMLKLIRDKYKANYTFGGYLEKRGKLWNGFENSKEMIHLGIDINNLTPGMDIAAPCGLTVVHVYVDSSEFNGWGTRIIFKMDKPYLAADYLLLGHLAIPQREIPVGHHFNEGEIVGRIGNYNDNGGWFIHLHVQLIKADMWNLYKARNELEKIDGYLLDTDIDKALDEKWSADPTDLIFPE